MTTREANAFLVDLRMADDLKIAKSTLVKLHQDMGVLDRLANPSYLGILEQLERAMEPIRRQQLQISCALERSGAAAQIKEIARANQHWQEVIMQTIGTSSIVERLDAVHQSWLDQFKPLHQEVSKVSQLQVSAKLALCDVSLKLSAAERLMVSMDLGRLRGRFQTETPIISELESSIARVAVSYGSLAGSLQDVWDITHLPTFVLPGATREIYTTSLVLETLQSTNRYDEDVAEGQTQLVVEAELEISGSVALLQQVDPGLARPYIGARDALYGSNADRARHILISLRELWSHLLRKLAPDAAVLAWVSEAPSQEGFLHEGKPTRRARVQYICRDINSDPLTDFLIHDTRALLKLIDLFSRIHELETELTDQQLRAMLLKTDSWLMYILQIAAGNRHG